MGHLSGKVVLITDLDPEVGPEVADRFLRAGASVLVTGFRAAQILSERFKDREGITFTGLDKVTTGGVSELLSRLLKDHGGLDVIFTNNEAHPDLDAEGILLKHTIGFSFTLRELTPILRDGGAIVVCVSFSPQLRQKSLLIVDSTTALMQYSAQYWAHMLEARRIRVNAISRYRLIDGLEDEDFDLSVGRQHAKPRTRPNTVKEVASAVVDLVDEDCQMSGADVTIMDGQPQISRLSPSTESTSLGSAAQVADNVIFLASEVSRPLTGIELFPDGEIRKL